MKNKKATKEQYNKEIDDAVERVNNGKSILNNKVIDDMDDWDDLMNQSAEECWVSGSKESRQHILFESGLPKNLCTSNWIELIDAHKKIIEKYLNS